MMNEIRPINRPDSTLPQAAAQRNAQSVGVPPAVRSSDRVELSQAAQLLAKLADIPDVRVDLVNQVRNEIANGTYLTDEKIAAATDALAEEL